jgi:DNA-binding HxlR family transcriptional regulator
MNHVEYRLTELGRSILGPLDAVCEWTEEHWDELLDARDGLVARAAEDVAFG